jgi:transcriptional regulator with XRE-family HTH domain
VSSFRTKFSGRRATFLALSNDVERQLRDAYARKFEEGVTQSALAEKLDVNRSAIHRRLTGRTNMTLETVADMVWALGQCVKVIIYDPATAGQNHFVPSASAQLPASADMPTAAEMPSPQSIKKYGEEVTKPLVTVS